MPLNTTVPELFIKVPLLVKLPARLRVAGDVNVPTAEIVMPLNVVDDDPVIELVPVKVTVFVSAPLLKVPLFVQIPATLKLPAGAVSELLLFIVTLLKELILDPEMVVVPPNVTVADPEFNTPLFVKLPLI